MVPEPKNIINYLLKITKVLPMKYQNCIKHVAYSYNAMNGVHFGNEEVPNRSFWIVCECVERGGGEGAI